MLLSVRTPPSLMKSVTPGPIHRSTGVPGTPEGREMKKVIVTEPPAGMGKEGEEARVILARSVRREICTHHE